ncbi:hypothetical protein, partial [Escherichia coli]
KYAVKQRVFGMYGYTVTVYKSGIKRDVPHKTETNFIALTDAKREIEPLKLSLSFPAVNHSATQ